MSSDVSPLNTAFMLLNVSFFFFFLLFLKHSITWSFLLFKIWDLLFIREELFAENFKWRYSNIKYVWTPVVCHFQIYIYCMLCTVLRMASKLPSHRFMNVASLVHIFDSQHHRNRRARDHSQFCDDYIYEIWRRDVVHQVKQAQWRHFLPVF